MGPFLTFPLGGGSGALLYFLDISVLPSKDCGTICIDPRWIAPFRRSSSARRGLVRGASGLRIGPSGAIGRSRRFWTWFNERRNRAEPADADNC